MTEQRITEAAPDQIEAVAALCGRAFTDQGAEFFLTSMREDPRAEEAVTLVSWVGEEMASSVRVYTREIRWRGGTVTLGCIGNVATDPAHRGKGLAGALMRHSIEVMQSRGHSLSLLFTDIPQMYAKFGYEGFDQPWWSVDSARIRPIGKGLRVRDAQWPRDGDAIQRLQAGFNEGHDGTLVRDAAQWRSMHCVFPTDDVISLVAERTGEIVAHARVLQKGAVAPRLHEVSATDAEAAAAVIAEAIRRSRALGDGQVSVTLPGWPLIREGIGAACEGWSVAPRFAGMWRGLEGGIAHGEIMERARAGELYFWAGDRF
ncbi:GNAT family N-acetyltransferase [Candidatus Sumerlaeota bacterium]|nr:GNAT family N-acetyltransferase [Candidatus Sumerlaeota bacterium]